MIAVVISNPLYQYDSGQIVQVYGADDVQIAVQISRSTSDRARPITVEADGVSYKISDALLTTPGRLYVYIVITQADGSRTEQVHTANIIARARPEDYVAPEEIPMWSKIEARVERLENNQPGGGVDLSGYRTAAAQDAIDAAQNAEISKKAASDHDYKGVYQPVGDYLTEETDPTVPHWAKAAQKPTYTAQEVGAHPDDWMPTAQDVGALPDTTEIPTTLPASDVYPWAKEATKPSYTADEVGARSADWTPTAAEVGALPADTTALPNPNKLTFTGFTGAVSAEYDGSSAVSLEIPQGGGFNRELLFSTVTTEPVNKISFTSENNAEFTNYVIWIHTTASTEITSNKTYYVRARDAGGGLQLQNQLRTYDFYNLACTMPLPVDVVNDIPYQGVLAFSVSSGADIAQGSLRTKSNVVQVYTNTTEYSFPVGTEVKVWGTWC